MIADLNCYSHSFIPLLKSQLCLLVLLALIYALTLSTVPTVLQCNSMFLLTYAAMQFGLNPPVTSSMKDCRVKMTRFQMRSGPGLDCLTSQREGRRLNSHLRLLCAAFAGFTCMGFLRVLRSIALENMHVQTIKCPKCRWDRSPGPQRDRWD